MLKITHIDEGLLVQIPYMPKVNAALKRIGEARYSRDHKGWIMQPCFEGLIKEKLVHYFGAYDDEQFFPDHLETLLDSFCKNDCSFVASSIWEDTGKGRFCRTGDVGEIDLIRALHSNPIGNQIFTRTEWLVALGGFDESLPASQDYDMWIRFIEAYGKGVKLESATYVWHTGHEEKRITNSNVKRLAALDMFFNKHEHLMSKEHIQSFIILRCKADPSHYSLGVMLKNINRWNYKSALSLYVHTRTPALGSLWRRLKLK